MCTRTYTIGSEGIAIGAKGTVGFSRNVAALSPSATIAVSSRAKELRAAGRDIVNLGAGEPDFDTPDFIVRQGIDAIREGRTRYTPAAGLPELRTAIADLLAETSGRAGLGPERIVVTAGAKQALFNACFVLFGPGDRVLLPTPYWTSYPQIVRLARAEPVEVRGDPGNGFKVTPDALDAAYDDRVAGLMLNSPNNPTGAVYDHDELDEVVRWAARRGVWVLSDEIYGRLCYTGARATGVLDLEAAALDRTVVIDGASKIFAMTGWRIGFSCSPPELAAKMAALQSHTTSNVSTPSQYAALAAYRTEPLEVEAVRRMVDTFERRRDLALERFADRLPSVEYVPPEGAFYLFFRVDAFFDDEAPDSVAFCRRLLERAGVAIVPGAAFGDDRYARLSFAAADDVLLDGIDRIAHALGA